MRSSKEEEPGGPKYLARKSDHSTIPKTCHWLQLSEHGVEAVRLLKDDQVGNPQLQILLVLEEIGLLSFLREAWVSQDQEICEEFVEHWNVSRKTTTVRGAKIELNLADFLINVSDFGSRWSTKPADRSTLTTSSAATKFSTLFPSQGDNWGIRLRRVQIATCRDELVRDLLLLLNKTLWFTSFRDPFRASRDLIYLVLDALDGTQFNWAQCIYKKFVAELKRLQMLRGGPCDQIRTQAGPLMYFLYTKAKRRADAYEKIARCHTRGTLVQVLAQRVDNIVMLDVSRDREKSAVEESTTFTNRGIATTKLLKSDEHLRLLSSKSSPRDPPAPTCSRTRPNKKRRAMCESLETMIAEEEDLPCTSAAAPDPTTKNDEGHLSATIEVLQSQIAEKNEEILRLQLAGINSRLNEEKMEKLYLEEQNHVQECMKLHFDALEAEEEVADLRARVNALEDDRTELVKRGRFLEQQLADMRKRWETAIVRAELAEIQAAEKSCLLLRLLHPAGK